MARAGAFQRPKARSAALPSSLRLRASGTPAPPPRPPPRAACRSIRLLCGSADRLSTREGSCVIWAVRRWKRGDGGGEFGRDGRLLEATDIATTEDKMLMEEVLVNNCWTCADAERACMLRGRPAICGSAFTGARRHHHLDHLAHLVVPLEQADCGDATSMEELTAEDRWLLPPLCFCELDRQARFDVCFCRHVVRRCDERGACVCERGRRWRYSRISACL